jgi:hypothetical protein
LVTLVGAGLTSDIKKAIDGVRGVVSDAAAGVGKAVLSKSLDAVDVFFRAVKDVNPYLTTDRIKSTGALIKSFDGLVTKGIVDVNEFADIEARIIRIGPIGQGGGYYPVPVVGKDQLKHLPGSSEFGKSVWTGGDPQKAILQKMGQGTFVQPNLELVEFDRTVGKVVGAQGEELGETSRAIIHYSKDWAHIVPEK